MKAIPFKYLEEGEKFIPVWIPTEYHIPFIKNTKGKGNYTAIGFENPDLKVIITREEMVMVDDDYNDSQYVVDELNKLASRLSKRFSCAENYIGWLKGEYK